MSHNNKVLLMPMPTELNEALEKKDWATAKQLLLDELRHGDDKGYTKEETSALIYNLILAYIGLKENEKAIKAYNRHKQGMTEEDREIIKEEIKKINTGASIETINKDGQIISISWFKSPIRLLDVIGVKTIKKELMKKIVLPIQHPDIYKSYGAKLKAGVLLFGPPGTGKTMMAKAVAGEVEGRMLILNFADVINRFVGDTEKNIKRIFDEAKEYRPSIVFIDELDGIASNRNEGHDSGQSTAMRSSINVLLTEIDGATSSNEGLFVLGSSNRPWDVDNAFKRSGRFSQLIYVPAPNTKTRIDLFRHYTKDLKRKPINYYKLGFASFGMTPADIMDVCNNAAMEKASQFIQDKKDSKVSTKDIMRQMKEKGKPSIFEWYAQTFEQFQKLSPDERANYGALRKDLIFWQTKAHGMKNMYSLLANIM